jgi:hypothetical protein
VKEIPFPQYPGPGHDLIEIKMALLSLSPRDDAHHPGTEPAGPEKFQRNRRPSNVPARGLEKRGFEDSVIAFSPRLGSAAKDLRPA